MEFLYGAICDVHSTFKGADYSRLIPPDIYDNTVIAGYNHRYYITA